MGKPNCQKHLEWLLAKIEDKINCPEPGEDTLGFCQLAKDILIDIRSGKLSTDLTGTNGETCNDIEEGNIFQSH